VYGPGSVSRTHGHPPTPYGFLRGTVTSVKYKKKLRSWKKDVFFSFFCMSSYLKHLSSFRAADKGNFEAAVKLGIAYLYNEGRKLSTTQLSYEHSV